jgi:uncharacterized membrane protein YfcA
VRGRRPRQPAQYLAGANLTSDDDSARICAVSLPVALFAFSAGLLVAVVATPGALLRYKRSGRLGGTLPRQLLTGTLPGVVLGTLVRVYLAPGDRIFRLLAAGVLLPLGLWLCLRRRDRPVHPRNLRGSTIAGRGLAVGIVGGIYGIGGGSLLGPNPRRRRKCPSPSSPPPR